MDLIDEVMPRYDRREVHGRAIEAAPDATWDALHELTSGEMRVMRALMGLRTLGQRRGAVDPNHDGVLDGFRRMGFRKVAEDPGHELVVAGIGRFWTPSGGLRKVEGLEFFTDFEEPGYAKVAFNFLLDGGRLSTETRIAGTDPRARRLFGAYWFLVRPGSGLIRREWLAAIAKRAETSPA